MRTLLLVGFFVASTGIARAEDTFEMEIGGFTIPQGYGPPIHHERHKVRGTGATGIKTALEEGRSLRRGRDEAYVGALNRSGRPVYGVIRVEPAPEVRYVPYPVPTALYAPPPLYYTRDYRWRYYGP